MSISLVGILFSTSCKKKDNDPPPGPTVKLEVIFNEIPYPTEKFLRIGYTIRTWEFEKDGLVLERIVILNPDSKAELMVIEKGEFPVIWKDPLPVIPFFPFDKLTHYYLSIQLPVQLEDPKPVNVSHRFEFNDTILNTKVVMDGAPFSPRLNESPIAISSPVKGERMVFMNQSTYGYHFRAILFMNGGILRPECFAFDQVQGGTDFISLFDGDPGVNESYFNYGDTLYAAANGKVITLVDGFPEQDGDKFNLTLNSRIEYGGNSLVLDLGNGYYAGYAHLIPGSFMVEEGDMLTEGDPIGLLGNSGNSTLPHLHFQIMNGPDFFFSHGVPFVLKKYTKIGEMGAPGTPTVYTNAMMEETTVITVD